MGENRAESADTPQQEHLGDRLYGERHRIATSEGVLYIDNVRVKEVVNGHQEQFLRGYWRGTCPVCGAEYERDGDDEERSRTAAWEAALECCGAEWLPPQDWVENCEVCGEDHRESAGCTVLYLREPFPKPKNHRYNCSECGWDGDATQFEGHEGFCPECGTAAVEAIEVED